MWAILGKRISSAGLTLRTLAVEGFPRQNFEAGPPRQYYIEGGRTNLLLCLTVMICDVSLCDWFAGSGHTGEQVCEHNLCLHCAAQLLESMGPGVCRCAEDDVDMSF